MLKQVDSTSNEYPPLLRTIKNPPEHLFILGQLQPLDAPTIAVVGSRRCTQYGQRVTTEITSALAQAGVVIVSGLAFGVDAVAHRAAIDVGGKTIAVLASPINEITPRANIPLARDILKHGGTIMSEFPPGTPTFKGSFPIRNRIISGLSLGVLVVEATSISGSLITTKFALEQGREVFAVPGPIDSETSQGTNALLKSGAHVVTSAHDVLDVLGLSGVALTRKATEPPKPDTKEESILLPLLTKQPLHLDEIIRKSGLPTATVSSCVMMMEIKAKIRHVGGNYYILG
ncbi:MAG: DNA-processing protein DprA [Patescibacteria group bacterium]